MVKSGKYVKIFKDTAYPFVVKSTSCVVYVYGTQFNISAYPDEPEIHTTLVDGKLAVENSYGYRKIKPGMTILLKGTSMGSVTDAQGNFKFEILYLFNLCIFSSFFLLWKFKETGNQEKMC